MKQTKEISIGEGTLIIESGYLAKQANGSCTVRLGDTVVLATACMENKGPAERDFLPLTVDYREYTYAAGRIPGGLLQARGATFGEGDHHLPPDRPPAAPPVPRGL